MTHAEQPPEQGDYTAKVARLNVSVTTDMIERAKRADSGHCMIADAIKVAVPHAKAVSVDLASIRFTNPRTGKRYLYLTPASVQEALLKFDNAVTPREFRFVLRAPAQITSSGTEHYQRGGRVRQGIAQVTNDPKDPPTRIGGTLPGIGAISNTPSQARADLQTKPAAASADTSLVDEGTTGDNTSASQPRTYRADNLQTSGDVMRGRRRVFGARKMGRSMEPNAKYDREDALVERWRQEESTGPQS